MMQIGNPGCGAYNSGLLGEWLPLNGGSDTRRASREAAFARAVLLGEWLDCRASMIRRQAMPLALRRGRRHVVPVGDGSLYRCNWLHWRKAKRLVRAGHVMPAMIAMIA